MLLISKIGKLVLVVNVPMRLLGLAMGHQQELRTIENVLGTDVPIPRPNDESFCAKTLR